MATREMMQESIEPGSTEYGSREALEQGLPSSGGQAPAPASAPTGPPVSQEVAPPMGSPMDMLLSGEYPHNPEELLGTGFEDPSADEGTTFPMAERLRAIAQHAKSPALRAQARTVLKVLHQRGSL